ncbi:MAG: 4Fe-4S dicluster domain-containing protein [archaeon]|nr:4Fe-4S dicluster domain-containing protein [archaeon]
MLVSIYFKPSKLIDLTKCIGCRACQVACKRWNMRPGEETSLSSDWTNPPMLSHKTWTHVKFKLMYDQNNDEYKWVFTKWQCMQCNDPPCLPVCPTKAIYKREDGIVHIHSERCIGCKYCVTACPYRARFYGYDEYHGIKSVYKCHFCMNRLDAGLEKPACVQACPTQALEFGERNEMIEKAGARAEAIGGYVFGDEEDIGNSVIYVSKVPFEELGFPTREMRVPAPLAMGKLLTQRGGIAIFGAGALAFLGFVLWRKERISRAKMREISKSKE